MHKLSLFILFFIISGCEPDPYYVSPAKKVSPAEKERREFKQVKKKLIGQHYSVVIQKMGAYTREVEDGLGGKILIWSKYIPAKTHTELNPLYGHKVLGKASKKLFYETHTPSRTEETQVFCDKSGIIYNIVYKKY